MFVCQCFYPPRQVCLCADESAFNRYVMLLEDDALVVPEFARMMTSLMIQLDRRPYIDYVKLYHPNQLRKIPSIPMAIALSLYICYLFQVIIFRRVFVLWLLATSALMYTILRSYTSQFLADVRYAVTKSVYMSVTESCCTPAVVFRARKIPEIVSKLSAVSNERAFIGHAKDHILDESEFIGRQTDTNLVVHIGAVSSVRKRLITLNEVLSARSRDH
ncbi:hypothetical protein TELCIR_07203 [Teladorsagia circumcincta]|uniref:Uncharacterized protein n=1 Tax=Teladorsagia circumcincta TaxID=45464 RepID=A0A2G9UL92_TELCI|nr:hypothetical protein TELCIR_07203 [Teladorsagia circumcincta]